MSSAGCVPEGAVLLGKTNLSEWANFRGKHSVSGWSSRGGLTRNPYALDRSACGSSTGSAVAVAADLCAAAVGTETDGSIICPSQTNGIVGLKPTLGLLSRSGVIPIAHSQDSPGPMARTVEDLALLLGALTGTDPHDPMTRAAARHAHRDYTRFLDPRGLKGARIGVARNMLGTDARLTRILETCLDILKRAGAVVVDPADVPNFDRFGPGEIEVLLFEFKADLNRYLASRGPKARVHSLEDVIRFNEDHRAQVMPLFGQERMIDAEAKGPLSSKTYRQSLARNRRLTRGEGLDATIKKHRPRRHRLPLRRAGLDHRLDQRRCSQLGHGEHLAARRRRLSSSHGAGRLPRRPSRRALLHRPGMAGACLAPPRLCFRAGEPRAPAANVLAERGLRDWLPVISGRWSVARGAACGAADAQITATSEG